MQIDITMNPIQIEQITVQYIVQSMDDLERYIIRLEKQAKAGLLTFDFAESLGDAREEFCDWEKVLKHIGYTYDDAAEKFNIPTLRRQETFTAV
jgi:hypothetical protein